MSGFQVGLKGLVSVNEALEKALEGFERTQPPLLKLELRTQPGGDALLVLLNFGDARSYTVNRPRVAALAKQLSLQQLELDNFSPERRAQFQTDLAAMSWHAQGSASTVFSEFRNIGKIPVLRMSFGSESELLQSWAKHVAEGALWVPTPRPSETKTFSVSFVIPSAEFLENLGTRVERAAPRGARHGLWLEIRPGENLKALLTRTSQRSKDARTQTSAPTLAVPAAAAETALEFRIDSLSDLAARYASDISRGGLFVATARPPALRSKVQLRLTLPNGETLPLSSEVVHRVADGPGAGVGLQFTSMGPKTFAPIEALLVEPPRQPKVLVIDDEAIWRNSLSRVLQGLGAEVIMANDGQDGLMKLIDGYFDLDLVILDLNMPHLDGRALINRVRRLGGDTALKMFLFSAVAKEELRAATEAEMATGFFSKLDSIEVLTAQLAKELQLGSAASTRS